MKVLHISTSDSNGGAAIAASRIHQSLFTNKDLQSSMFVAKKNTDIKGIQSFQSDLMKFYTFLKTGIGSKISKIQITKNKSLHSVSCLPCRLEKFINESSYDLINLHWIQGEMLSIESIGRIKKPLIWTLHDNWAFSGSEHLPLNRFDIRYREGYFKQNKPKGHGFLDMDRWCWERKKNSWKIPMQIICPSKWLSECAKSSALMNSWNIDIIPHPIDTSTFKPFSKKIARNLFNFPLDKKLILFGAMDGTKDLNKGWDLLSKALEIVNNEISDSKAIVLGQSQNLNKEDIKMPVSFIGKLKDSQALAMLYSAADITIVPSRIESFGQMASESSSCGTPVIGFDYSGIRDIIENDKTGYLIKPYDYELLAEAIIKLLKNQKQIKAFGKASRKRAEELWSYKVVSKIYYETYLKVLGLNKEMK